MIIRTSFGIEGYQEITREDGPMLMDFGTIDIRKHSSYFEKKGKERVVILIKGELQFKYGYYSKIVKRDSFLDEKPIALHIDKSLDLEMVAISDVVNLAICSISNDKEFEPLLFMGDMVSEDIFGKAIKDRTAERKVRTIFDLDSRADSMLTVGEVINYPGSWSSFPPHSHRHPEIYHYRFSPEQGFGISVLGENAFKVKDRDTSAIIGGVTHSQVSAPGYAMYYIWIIPHLEGNKWSRSSCDFDKDHLWMLDEYAEIYQKEDLDE